MSIRCPVCAHRITIHYAGFICGCKDSAVVKVRTLTRYSAPFSPTGPLFFHDLPRIYRCPLTEAQRRAVEENLDLLDRKRYAGLALELCEAASTWNPDLGPFRPRALARLRSRAIDQHRRERRYRTTDMDDVEDRDTAILPALAEAIDRLPPIEREAIQDELASQTQAVTASTHSLTQPRISQVRAQAIRDLRQALPEPVPRSARPLVVVTLPTTPLPIAPRPIAPTRRPPERTLAFTNQDTHFCRWLQRQPPTQSRFANDPPSSHSLNWPTSRPQLVPPARSAPREQTAAA